MDVLIAVHFKVRGWKSFEHHQHTRLCMWILKVQVEIIKEQESKSSKQSK